MNYLHTKTPAAIVHGDLKVQNVLIGDGFIAKVNAVPFCVNCDFGIIADFVRLPISDL